MGEMLPVGGGRLFFAGLRGDRLARLAPKRKAAIFLNFLLAKRKEVH
ncbi:hypothetical protein [Geobacillus sp. C56-T2]|nr:hypothetical protein [Geobacillus sp. C56-T2]